MKLRSRAKPSGSQCLGAEGSRAGTFLLPREGREAARAHYSHGSHRQPSSSRLCRFSLPHAFIFTHTRPALPAWTPPAARACTELQARLFSPRNSVRGKAAFPPRGRLLMGFLLADENTGNVFLLSFIPWEALSGRAGKVYFSGSYWPTHLADTKSQSKL